MPNIINSFDGARAWCRRRVLVLTGLLGLILALVNGAHFPLSVPYVVAETGHNYLDMCGFCGSSAVLANLALDLAENALIAALLIG